MAGGMRMRAAIQRGAFRTDDGSFRDHAMAGMNRAMAIWIASEIDNGAGVEIDNIFAYLLGKEGQSIDLGEFQGARPPWERCWLEGDMPQNTGIPRAGVRIAASTEAAIIQQTNARMRGR